MKALLFLPALLPKPKVGSPSRVLFHFLERHLGQEGVEILSSQMFDPGRGHDPMAEVGHLDHGEVERAAPQVVHQKILPPPFGAPLAVSHGIFHPRGRRFIDHAQDLKPGLAECFQCEETLIVVGVGRDSDHDFEVRRSPEAQVGSFHQIPAQSD